MRGILVVMLALVCVGVSAQPIEVPLLDIDFEMGRGSIPSFDGNDFMTFSEEAKAAIVIGFMHGVYTANVNLMGFDGDQIRMFTKEDLGMILYMLNTIYAQNPKTRDAPVSMAIATAWINILDRGM